MMLASKYYQADTTTQDLIQSKLAGKNHEAEDKMATKRISIAEELLNAVTPEPFTKVLCLLHDTRAVSPDDFKRKRPELMKHHWLDSTVLLSPNKSKPTCTGLFEIFGKLCSVNAVEMKEQLIDWICDNRVDLANCMSIALNQSNQSLTDWLKKLTMNDDFVPDELTLYCLARFTGHHALVYTNDFCWSTLLNQFRLSEDALYERSKVKLVYVGHHMFNELKDIRLPKPSPPEPALTTKSVAKKQKRNKRSKKVTSRGDKPKPKRTKKSVEPVGSMTPVPLRPTRRNRKNIDYFKLNDGLDEPVVESPKHKKQKPYSPPPRAGPSTTRQAARKRKSSYDITEEMKLPDLVSNTCRSDALNDGTINDPPSKSKRAKLTAVEQASNDPVVSSIIPASDDTSEPEKTTLQPNVEPIGHDTCTTTDEEDAIEALLALSELPGTSNTVDVQNDNEQLMPIGNFNTGIDINPVEIKLGTDDVAKAIAEIPTDHRFMSSDPNTKTDASSAVENPNKNDSTSESESDQRPKTPPTTNKDTTDNPVPDHISPNKGTLKVTKYGLRKSHHKTRSYKCQNCGKRERSVRELNDHHRQAHPPLLCSDCNKIFYVPSTFQLHLYEHQKDNKVICETCGKKFSFKGQLDQHRIVHRSIKTHKCMAKNCDRWFMRKADLKVHTATHDKKEYTCEHCASFKTSLKKYWKEHMKGHDDILPYACSICKKRFLYRQQVSRHKAKDHK